MSALLSVDISAEESATRLDVAGELDVSTVDQLREALEQLGVEGAELRLDLGGVTFMDSSGIRALMEADAAARANGHTLSITRPSRQVRRILEAVGVWDEMPIARHLRGL
jgi:anti-sigma B factor antagonist